MISLLIYGYDQLPRNTHCQLQGLEFYTRSLHKPLFLTAFQGLLAKCFLVDFLLHLKLFELIIVYWNYSEIEYKVHWSVFYEQQKPYLWLEYATSWKSIDNR